jgi:lipid II isoglutaminyl synthase (glutamine-hydrolysing)
MAVLLCNARRPPREWPSTSARQRLALLAGRLAGVASRRFGRGGGTALPGLVAARIAPDLVEALGAAERGVVLITGTNGKTTTAHLLAAAARAGGLDVTANPSGSNLERGLVGALVDAAGPLGERPAAQGRAAVLEVDEAAAASLLPRVHPTVAVFLNLFRDQLDRYGEVDSIARGWWHALESEGGGPTLVLNADDPSVAQLADVARGNVVYFGVEDPAAALPVAEHAADARFCRCGGTFEYTARFIGHMGHWRCARCGRTRPAPEVTAHRVQLDDAGARFELRTAEGTRTLALPLAGLHSVYNALATAAAGLALGLPPESTAAALAESGPAFGRQERFQVRGREVRILLAKNPAGLNEVIRTLAATGGPLNLLWLLNDGIQDGRDVSWIYDADVEVLAGRPRVLVAGGSRAHDLALRLHLGGLEPDAVDPGVRLPLTDALARVPEGARLDVVATYTAMLEARAQLADWTDGRQYWMKSS